MIGLSCAIPVFANAQDAAPRQVRGRVINPEGAPIAGAVLEVVGTRWRARTDGHGAFDITLPAGEWRLAIARLGYQPDTVLVLPGSATAAAPLAIELAKAPQALAGVDVQSATAPAMARSVTRETVRQVPPLGEPDLLRALVFLPAISQPNDLKGRVHLAGGGSDETAFLLDGHPLQDPYHLLGLLGAFNVSAIERTEVLIHHVPAAVDGRASGVVDLQTRGPSVDAESELVVSLLSSSATVQRRRGRFDLLASGRLTYLDKLIEHLAADARVGGDELPLLGYRDGLLRLGFTAASQWRVEAVGFHTRDAVGVTRVAFEEGERPLTWGETMGGVRVWRSTPNWNAMARVSSVVANTAMDSSASERRYISNWRRWTSMEGRVGRNARRWDGLIGISAVRRDHRHHWNAGTLTRLLFTPSIPMRFVGQAEHRESAVYVDASSILTPWLSTNAGIRVTSVGAAWFPAPRLAVTIGSVGPRLQASYNRRYQFITEPEEPIEGSIAIPLFLVPMPRRADVYAASADWDLLSIGGASGSVGVQAFHKAYGSRPQILADQQPFPTFSYLAGRASGATLSLRAEWPAGVLVQGSYTFQSALERFGSQWVPTAWDAPHDLSAFVAMSPFSKWSITAAYRGHSGHAVTPVEVRIFEPEPQLDTSLRGRFIRGIRRSARVPAYHRVDIGTRRTWRARGAEWTFFAQVLNALNRSNPIDYSWAQYTEEPEGAQPVSDRSGLPVLPTFGLELRW